MTAGARAFAAFLQEKGLSDAKAGALLGVTDVTVYHWRVGKKVPMEVARKKIAIFTSQVDAAGSLLRAGIPPLAWSDGEDEKALEGVRPFDAPPAAAARKPENDTAKGKPDPPPSGPVKPARAGRPRASTPTAPAVGGTKKARGPKAEAAA